MQRRHFINLLCALAATTTAGSASAEEPGSVDPVLRIANATSVKPSAEITTSPLDPVLDLARECLNDCQTTVDDYTALLVKRERVGEVLGQHEYMMTKIRCRKVVNNQVQQPLCVYLGFVKPASVKGREVLYVEGKNDGNLLAHEGGFKGKFLPTVSLAPTGSLAMRGQRYPMTEIGVENLLIKLIERGEKARRIPDVSVDLKRGVKISKRKCSVLTVTLPTPSDDLAFHQAKVYMDEEIRLPIRYVAYDWPKDEGERPEILEEYTYLNLKTNVGLTDADFDPSNESYNF